MVRMSDAAYDQLKSIKNRDGKTPDWFIRVKIKKGGCSGMSYKLDFDNSVQDGDHIFETNDERIVVDPDSYLYLIGLTLDYEGGLNGKGFIFQNPNASKTCGCGASFNV